MKTFKQFINEGINDYLQPESEKNNKRFEVDNKNNKFKLFMDDVLVSESSFTIESPDKWFDEKYATLYDLETFSEFRGKGLAKYLLYQIFDYIKNDMSINIICLIVFKDNPKAINLYFRCGFEIYMEYDDSYSLIKKL